MIRAPAEGAARRHAGETPSRRHAGEAPSTNIQALTSGFRRLASGGLALTTWARKSRSTLSGTSLTQER